VSLERPWALVLLAVPVILLWLRLRSARPRAEEASSLLVWKKVSPADTVPARPRPPLSAWLEAAGAALLAAGMAGPFLPGIRPEDPIVLLDGTPSMEALRPGGRPRSEAALVAPGMVRFHARPELAQSADDRNFIFVTDHRWPHFPDDPPLLRTVGVGDPCFNAGITIASGAVLPDGRWRLFLVVEAFGEKGPIEGKLRIGDIEETLTLGPGTPLEVLRDVPAGVAGAAIRFPGDALAADDAVVLMAAGGRPVEVLAPDRKELEPLVRAFVAAGATREIEIETATDPSRPVTVLLLSGREPCLRLEFPVTEPEEKAIQGREVTTADHPLLRDLRIDPGVTLGARGKPGGLGDLGHPETAEVKTVLLGRGILADGNGDLVSMEDNPPYLRFGTKEPRPPVLVLHFDFFPGGTWVERDPSFVVFAKNLVDHVAEGPARIEARGVLDARETREAAEGESFGDLRAAIEEARRPDPASRNSWAFALLCAGAGLLTAAWLALR
jgi:hypothetical protein